MENWERDKEDRNKITIKIDDFLEEHDIKGLGDISQRVLDKRRQLLNESKLVGVPYVILFLYVAPILALFKVLPKVLDFLARVLTNASVAVHSGIAVAGPAYGYQVNVGSFFGNLVAGINDPAMILCWAFTIWILYGLIWRKNYRLLWHPEMYFGLFTGYFVSQIFLAILDLTEKWVGSLSFLGNESILTLPARLIETYGSFIVKLFAELGITLPSLPFTIPARVIAMYIILYFVSNKLSVVMMQVTCQAAVCPGRVSYGAMDLSETDISSDRAVPRNLKIYFCHKDANFQMSRSCVFVDAEANNGVLMHEIGHVSHKDAFAMSFLAPTAYALPILLSGLVAIASLIPGVGPTIAALFMLTHYVSFAIIKLYMLLTTFIQRQYESAADWYAFKHGFGQGLVDFFSGCEDLEGIRAFFDPHPKTSIRRDRLKRWLERSERKEERKNQKGR